MKIATCEEVDTSSCILFAEISQRKMRDHLKSIPNSILRTDSAFFAVESSPEYIKADDVITFCLHLMNKMWLNLFKISSSAIFRWFSLFCRFSIYFLVDEGLAFLLVD